MQLPWMIAGVGSTIVTAVTMADAPVLSQMSGIPGAEGEPLFKYVFGGGAVTILGALAFYLAIYIVPRLQDKHQKTVKILGEKHEEAVKVLGEKHEAVIRELTGRFDGWEQTRHNDANALNVTLRDITAHCSQHRTRE